LARLATALMFMVVMVSTGLVYATDGRTTRGDFAAARGPLMEGVPCPARTWCILGRAGFVRSIGREGKGPLCGIVFIWGC
jgi:hypothetical protein